MSENPLVALSELGQSIWIDDLDRARIVSGQLHRHIEHDALRGMTTNPTIFEKAIDGDRVYDDVIRELAVEGDRPAEIYDAIAIADVRLAADEFRAVFDRLDQRDGFVSLEVSPHLAYDTRATIAEARRLWTVVERPNVMIKVPATEAGIPAIEALIAEGININVTLLFGLDRYAAVADAYLAGLRSRGRQRRGVRLASVASFFLSRIDTMVDAELDARVRARELDAGRAKRLRGRVAIASARLAYQHYKALFGGSEFAPLAAMGARPQRVLWASTSTKDPAYDDIYYVEALIGESTVDTVPIATLEAYRDHGHPERRLERGVDEAQETLRELARVGIELDAITQRLERDGVRKFCESYDKLLAAIAKRSDAAPRA
ncbi:MAG TPA: transaldolase [Kofleriaceae bacterium]|nr:transaldolase [Kofleriaceae bacterium]